MLRLILAIIALGSQTHFQGSDQHFAVYTLLFVTKTRSPGRKRVPKDAAFQDQEASKYPQDLQFSWPGDS